MAILELKLFHREDDSHVLHAIAPFEKSRYMPEHNVFEIEPNQGEVLVKGYVNYDTSRPCIKTPHPHSFAFLLSAPICLGMQTVKLQIICESTGEPELIMEGSINATAAIPVGIPGGGNLSQEDCESDVRPWDSSDS